MKPPFPIVMSPTSVERVNFFARTVSAMVIPPSRRRILISSEKAPFRNAVFRFEKEASDLISNCAEPWRCPVGAEPDRVPPMVTVPAGADAEK